MSQCAVAERALKSEEQNYLDKMDDDEDEEGEVTEAPKMAEIDFRSSGNF